MTYFRQQKEELDAFKESVDSKASLLSFRMVKRSIELLLYKLTEKLLGEFWA